MFVFCLFLIRALLREVVRALRYDLPLHVFCAALFQATQNEKRDSIIKDFEFKVRYFGIKFIKKAGTFDI